MCKSVAVGGILCTVCRRLDLKIFVTVQDMSYVSVLSSSVDMTGRRRVEDDYGENPRLALQRFVYDDDGFIACRADPNLVLGVHEQDSGPGATVCLVRRQDEDVYQRWIIHDNGYQLISSHLC